MSILVVMQRIPLIYRSLRNLLNAFQVTVSSSEEGRGYSPINRIGPKEDQLQKIKQYEDMYRKIRDVTGVQDVVKMVARFESQLETMQHLNNLKIESETIVAELQKELKDLKTELDNLKFTGDTELEKWVCGKFKWKCLPLKIKKIITLHL